MNIKFFVILFLSVVAESVVSFPFTLIAIIIVSIFMEEGAVLLAFVSGLLLDLLDLRFLGTDSLYFLVLIFLGIRYKKKIYGGAFIYRFLYFFISFSIYSILFYKKLNPAGFAVTIFLGSVILFALEKMFPATGSKKRLVV